MAYQTGRNGSRRFYLCPLHKSLHLLYFIYESMDLFLFVNVESSPLRTARKIFLSSCQALQSTYSKSSSPKPHLKRCHVMSMIHEYDLSTSQIRWSRKQVNSWVNEEEFICRWFYFLSKVLYLKTSSGLRHFAVAVIAMAQVALTHTVAAESVGV